MLEAEEVRRAADVVVVQVREDDNVVAGAADAAGVITEDLWKVDPLIGRIVGAAHVRVVDEDLAAIGQVDPSTVGIAEVVEGQLVHGDEGLKRKEFPEQALAQSAVTVG